MIPFSLRSAATNAPNFFLSISVDEYFYPDMGADEAAKKRINILLNSLNESELRLVEGIINAIIENRGTEGA